MRGVIVLKQLGSLALALVLALLPLSAALAQQTASTPEGTSKLIGKIYGQDGKPLAGATVVAYHLSSEQTYEAQPTETNGQYSILDLPYGYFDLAVITADGWFVGTQVVNLAPSATGSVNFTLSEDLGDQVRSFPGATEDPSGIAQVKEKLKGKAFWTGPKGIAIIVASGAAAVLLIAGGSSSSSSSGGGTPSPSSP